MTTADAFRVRLLNLIYPPRCEVCGAALSEREDGRLCGNCSRTLIHYHSPEASACCSTCGEPAAAAPFHDICIACLIHPLGVRTLRSLWVYNQAAERLIKAYKYGKRRALSGIIADGLAAYLLSAPCYSESSWDAVAAVPSGRGTLLARGFNHTGLLASELAIRLGIDYSPRLLHSGQDRPAQAGVNLKIRVANVHHAWVAGRSVSAGRKILLVDDLTTSGASIVESARALFAGGAVLVDAITAARRPGYIERRLAAFSASTLAR